MRKAILDTNEPSFALAPLPDLWRDLQDALPPLDSFPQPSGLYTYTGVLAKCASPDEEKAWLQTLQSDPSLPSLWLQTLDIHHEAEETEEASLARLLERGEGLAASLPSLPSALWETPEPALPPTQAPRQAPPRPPASLAERFRLWLSSTLWPFAAVTSLFLLLPYALLPSSTLPPLSGVRAKGSTLHPKGKPSGLLSETKEAPPIHFSFFHRRETQIQKGHDQMIVRPGDELRFAYRNLSGLTPYLLLFLIDEKGDISPLYPASEKKIFALTQGPIIYLPDGATLDDSPSLERIFVCVSQTPLTLEEARRDLLPLLKRTPLSRLARLSLPCLYQASWLLKKATGTP